MLYNPQAFFTHAAWLHQGFPHCARFLTAAARRRRDRVSVPVWGIALSRPLPVIGLVGHYPTNYLIGRRSIPKRRSFSLFRAYAGLAAVSSRYPPLRGRSLRVTHPFATLPSRRIQRFPFDLHVLGTPPAFILSQDQTLRKELIFKSLSLLPFGSSTFTPNTRSYPQTPHEIRKPHRPPAHNLLTCAQSSNRAILLSYHSLVVNVLH